MESLTEIHSKQREFYVKEVVIIIVFFLESSTKKGSPFRGLHEEKEYNVLS